jgi:hypothetical protein
MIFFYKLEGNMKEQKNDIYTHWSKLIEAVIRDVPGLTFIKEVKFKKENYNHANHGHINRSAHIKYQFAKSPEQDGEGDWIHQDDCNWFPAI